MIAQALDSGKKSKWTVVMVGGGHFAAAVFQSAHLVLIRPVVFLFLEYGT